jgi:predicted RND superfamily exporter protein
MMVLSIDVTPWAVVAGAFGALFGAWARPRLYNIFAVLSAFFGAYASATLFGMAYNIFTTASWLLSIFLGTASVVNLIATWVKRVETELRAVREHLEFLRLAIEER